MALIQLRHNIIVTIGHIPGKKNHYPDAISRRFLVPNGLLLHSLLSHLPHYNLNYCLTPVFVLLACTLWSTPSLLALASLTVVESLTGIFSALITVNLPMPRCYPVSYYD